MNTFYGIPDRRSTLLAAISGAQSLCTVGVAAAAGLVAYRAAGRRPADERAAVTVLAGLGTAVITLELVDAVLAPVRHRIAADPGRAPALPATAAPTPGALKLTTMQELEFAAASAAAYNAQLNSNLILGTSGPLQERGVWTGAVDGSATHDLPYGAVLHHRPAQLVDGVLTQAKWDERFVLEIDGLETTVTTGAEVLAHLRRAADGEHPFGPVRDEEPVPGCWPEEDGLPDDDFPDEE